VGRLCGVGVLWLVDGGEWRWCWCYYGGSVCEGRGGDRSVGVVGRGFLYMIQITIHDH
jgi:hypothetical protein